MHIHIIILIINNNTIIKEITWVVSKLLFYLIHLRLRFALIYYYYYIHQSSVSIFYLHLNI